MFWRSSPKQKGSCTTVKTQYRNLFDFLIGENHLPAVVAALNHSVHDIFALARVNTATWAALAPDHKLWRGVYVENDPLVTPDIR
jgi:hypothetical protein